MKPILYDAKLMNAAVLIGTDGNEHIGTSMPIEKRNQLVMDHLWCIDSVIRQNHSLIQAAHLDKEDVYQSLAMRLIRAVELYRPGAKSLKGYVFMQLKYELLNCKSAKARYGFCAAPYDLRGAVVSWEAWTERNPHWESVICAIA